MLPQDMPIIDAHCHVASTRFIPSPFFEGIARNILASMRANGQDVPLDNVLALLLQNHQDHEADKLIQEMNDAQIETSILLLPDFTFALSSELSIEKMYELHLEILQKHPGRLRLFAGIDPRWGEQGISLFERYVRDGLVQGLKLYPPCGYSPSDESLFPLYRICEEFHLPVLLHTGASSPVLSFSYAEVMLIDDAAMRFPNVNFILAHAGVNSVEKAAELCRFRDNVYMDISGFSTIRKPGGWQAHLTYLFSLELNHKIIFGTDWPISGLKESTQSIVEKLLGPEGPLRDTPEDDIKNIMYGNINRLLAG